MYLIRRLGNYILRLNQSLWRKTSSNFKQSRLGLAWGRMIYTLVILRGGRGQLTTTYFFRNRAELQMLVEIIRSLFTGQLIKIAVVGCSSGAEVYSIIHVLKKNLPVLNFEIRAYDIDGEALETAKMGIYPVASREVLKCNADEISELFERDGQNYKVRSQFKKNIHWELNDPTQEPLLSSIPKQDLVIANRFLFHMSKKNQRQTMIALSSMVRAGGYISVVGADLDVRTRVAKKLAWLPLTDNMESIHEGDDTMTCDWPFEYWGLEPFDKQNKNKKTRYCSFFQIT